jgi:hypothetical protein
VRKKNCLFLVFCDVVGVFCGGFLSCLWWPANYVVVGEVAATIGEKKKKKMPV